LPCHAALGMRNVVVRLRQMRELLRQIGHAPF
jgi:hypothetical protein